MAGLRRGQSAAITRGPALLWVLLLVILSSPPAGAQSEFGGLGTTVAMEDGLVKVVASIDGSPAAKAGIMAGDFITELDGEPVKGLTLQQAVDKMRGPVNSTIKLTIIRKGQDKPIEVTLVRKTIKVQSAVYDRPVLIIDPDMHTARILAAAVEPAGRFAVTGSDDKTVRVWSVRDGKLLQTIRVPAGPDHVGKINAVAMSPDGDLVAAGGSAPTTQERDFPIYLFDRRTGEMTRRIAAGLPGATFHLVFSADGRFLAATLAGGKGLRIYDRDNKWSEAFRDTDYGSDSYRGAFADDGRLATTAFDGKIRLYDSRFKLIGVKGTTSGRHPFGIAFSPDGKVLAIGYNDVPAVDFLDGHTLATIPAPTADGLRGSLPAVAWSADGQTLFAGGTLVFAWADAGHGKRRAISVFGHNSIASIVALATGQLLAATMDPYLAVLEANGTPRWAHGRLAPDFRGQQATFAVSPNGAVLDFGFDPGGKFPLRFDLKTFSLSRDPPADRVTRPPKQDGLSIDHWVNSASPTLNGKPIGPAPLRISRSLAVHPDGERFVLGMENQLRAFDAEGKTLWRREVTGEVWAVNVTGDGRMVVSASSDGTIRWHRMDDGREFLALMVLDRQNWAAWTPEGFYAATPGAYGVLRWHVNHGVDAAATTVPVSAIPKLRRPDALPLVLQELETARALGIADLAAARRDVQEATEATNPPGARLHVLTIGINDYGDKAKHLHLDFASTDANDVFNALVNTQDSRFNKLGGLYAEVMPAYVHDDEATKEEVYEALGSMQRNMAGSNGEDLAVVMFSGHGAILDGRFYLLPYGANAATSSRLEATAIPATELQAKLAELAKHGRVLVLLDACHSGAVTDDGTQIAPSADLLRSALIASNVTVLTSSNADEVSREDPNWGNGAFTKALLEALKGAADTNNDGLISISELTDYLSWRVPELTGGHQHVGLEQGFQRQLFVAGLR